jgi:hypothetical protein
MSYKTVNTYMKYMWAKNILYGTKKILEDHMARKNRNILFILVLVLLAIFVLTSLNLNNNIKLIRPRDTLITTPGPSKASVVEIDEHSRDFYRYKCKNRTRIGGDAKYLNIVPDKLYRVEGIPYLFYIRYLNF